MGALFLTRFHRSFRKQIMRAVMSAWFFAGVFCFGEAMSKGLDQMFTLVGGETPSPVIVCSKEKDKADNPLVEFAAADLSRYIKQVTGKDLLFGEEQADSTCIHIGQTRYVKALRLGLEHLDYDGFIVCTRLRGNVPQLIIAGRTPFGTYLGVNYFLREYVGVQWLFPGKLGEIIPNRPEINISAELDDKQEPDFIQRVITHESGKYWEIFKLRSLLNPVRACSSDETNPHPEFSPEWIKRTYVGHELGKVISPERYWGTHPEYFPMINGERRKPRDPAVGWQPCLSNPEVVALFIKAAQAYFDESPDHLCFSLAENDSGGYCECENCNAMDYSAAKKWATDLCRNYADRSWKFYVQVADAIAKSHPGRYLGVYSYLWSNEPPSDPSIKIPGNIVIRKTFPHQTDVGRFERWSALGLTFCCHDYMYDTGFHEFRHYPHQIAYELRFRYRRGTKTCWAESYSRASKSAPKLWIWARLAWNINEDVDALMEEYCQFAYGAAAVPMLKFWNKWEEIYMRQDESARRIFYTDCMVEDSQLRNVTTEDLVYLSDVIEQAGALAAAEDDKARVEMVASEYEQSKIRILSVLAVRIVEENLKKYSDKDVLIAQMVDIETLSAQHQKEGPFGRSPETGNFGYPGDIWNVARWSRIPGNFEKCQDQIAQEITARLNGTNPTDQIIQFWETQACSNPQLAEYADTQIYCLNNPARKNLLQNPAFNGVVGQVEHWNGARKKSLYVDDEHASTQVMEHNKIGYKGFFFTDRLYQDVEIETGGRYHAKISILNHVKNNERMAWSDTAEAGIEIIWLGGDGSPLQNQHTVLAYTKNNNDEWEDISLTASAPEQAVAARFGLYAKYYLDGEKVLFQSPVFEQICSRPVKKNVPEENREWIADLGDGVGMTFVPIAPGSFLMGSENFGSDENAHRVTISKPFWISSKEVTNEEYQQFLKDSGYDGASDVRSDYYLRHYKDPDWSKYASTNNKYPIVAVSWENARNFCEWLTAKERRAGHLPAGYEVALPTEAQWEYACRAGTAGDAFGAVELTGWYLSNADMKTHPGKQKLPNAWGLYDMLGNVWEWCADSADLREGTKTDTYFDGAVDPQCQTGARRLIRGGSWGSEASRCRPTCRYSFPPDYACHNLGFRPIIHQK